MNTALLTNARDLADRVMSGQSRNVTTHLLWKAYDELDAVILTADEDISRDIARKAAVFGLIRKNETR